MLKKLTPFALAAALIITLMLSAWAQERPLSAQEQYPYGSAAFDRFVRDSSAWSAEKGSKPDDFYKTFDAAARKVGENSRADGLAQKGVVGYLTAEKARIAGITAPADKAAAQTELSATVFRIVKKALPAFSLDRGFEFTSAAKSNERQCLLQAVLAAGMLQKAGVPAGIAMVWKSERGEISNLGHCIAVVRLADGNDRILDISSDRHTNFIPDLPHQGLFLADAKGDGYRFVEPQFDAARRITAYKLTGTGKRTPTDTIALLDAAFVRSQFYYYRGERASGHLIWSPVEPATLPRSADALTRSIQICPQNPLAMYMLGKVLVWQGKAADAQPRFVEAHRLYRAQGRVPDSAQEVYALEKTMQAKQ